MQTTLSWIAVAAANQVPGKELVVLVHGLFMNGCEMVLFQRWLKAAGYSVERFHYRSVHTAPATAAEQLRTFLVGLTVPKVHFVCHSLGGLVIRHYFAKFPDPRHARVVTLGTPHQVSRVALQLAKSRIGRMLLGQSKVHGLCGDAPAWAGDSELGVIAGNVPAGFGRIVQQLPRPNDGTVSVSETQLPNAKDHITLPVSHMGVLVSTRAIHQTTHFLRYGRFDHTAKSRRLINFQSS